NKILSFLQNTLYLFHLYFKRGIFKSIFYLLTLVLIFTLVGFLLEANAKMGLIADEANKLFPADKIKVTIPQKVRKSNAVSNLFSLLKGQPQKVIRQKDFISAEQLKTLSRHPGIKKVIPMLNIDFPLGVGINFFGNAFYFEGIGISLLPADAKAFVKTKPSSFQIQKNEVPVLVASYLIDIFKIMSQNTELPIKITQEAFLGFRFNARIGSSFLTGKSSSEEFQKEVSCKIVGFIDIDYSYGLVFPESFIRPFKEKYWSNFKKGSYDRLMLEIELEQLNSVETFIRSKGFIIEDDGGMFNSRKISSFINQNKEAISLFLKLISFIITLLGGIIALYTVLWMLKDRGLEFSLYRYFGSSNLRIMVLYGSYLTAINLLALYFSQSILHRIYSNLGKYILNFKDQIPQIFKTLLQDEFLLKNIILGDFFSIGLIFLEACGFTVIALYLAGLNKKL
ncbi:MAG: hypothetical protein CVV50_02205, partial [Spirochaetae bacterium HGW-Spirochaetae-6]